LAPKGLVIGRNIPISDQRLFSSFEDCFGSGPVFSARSSDGPLPGVELTETGESGPLANDLPLSGV
jgi:hypothetical protein